MINLSIKAIAKGKKDIVNILIQKGANVNKRDKNGQTALIYGMQQVYFIIRYLIVDIII